ncbi:MAG: tetratricopeptide repeat protein [Spirochaetes bacterium]|nr:tetratricopeptide repeat protein [Spirochaetota bacterium]
MTDIIKQKFAKAIEFEKTGEYQTALSLYALISKENPDFRPVFLNMGSLYSRMGKIDDAMKCFRRAGELGEDYLNWFNIGSIYYKKGNFKQAVISFERSRKLNKSFILSALVTGLAYSRLKNLKGAETVFSEVLSIDPENKVALNALSLLYYESGRFDKSLKLCEKITSSDKENINAVKLKSSIYYEIGEYDKSAEILKKVKSNDKSCTTYDSFVKSLPVEIYTDRYGTIEKKIERLTEKSTETGNPEDYISLSLCHLLNGNTDMAIDTLFMVKKNQPKSF